MAMQKTGEFKVERDGKEYKVLIRMRVDEHGLPKIANGALSLTAECDELGIKVEGTDKDTMIAKVKEIVSKTGTLKWERWLEVQLEKFNEITRTESEERDSMLRIKYDVIERANIGTEDELWKDIAEYERGQRSVDKSYWNRGCEGLPRGIRKQKLVSGLRDGNRLRNDSEMAVYIPDTDANRQALDDLMDRTLSIYDSIVRLSGRRCANFENVIGSFSATPPGTPALPPAPEKRKVVATVKPKRAR